MTKIQKLFVLSIFAFITLFNQTTADAAAFIKFDGIDGESYAVERVEAPPANGDHLVATHKRSGNRIMLTARGGKIQKMFIQSASGKIKVLKGTAAACSQDGFCTTFQIKRCFIDNGQCFCVCGDWFADSSGGSTNATVNIAGLPDGVNVVAQGVNSSPMPQTREHVLLAVIMEKGRVKGMGSIDQTGSFHKFEPDTPCSDFELALCKDGSKPDTYYDSVRDECVSFCDDIIDLDHTGYKPINPYGLRPNGPCSDFIAQPCRKGTSMVVYYDAHTEKCVMMCDY